MNLVMPMLYTSKENPKVKEIKRLHQKKYRDQTSLFLVEGEHLVLEAYKKGVLKELLLEQDQLFPLDVPVSYYTKDVIKSFSLLETPVTVMGICKKMDVSNELGNRVLWLENIQDPGNLGTIIRSAVAFHIDTIILGDHTVDLYNEKVVRATQGLLFHINIVRGDTLLEVPRLKEMGYTILGTRVTHGKSLRILEKQERFVIIMGNEGSGISEEVSELVDEFLYIDMSSVCESLNVAVAASIILYELDK